MSKNNFPRANFVDKTIQLNVSIVLRQIPLTLSCRMSLSNRNQFINFLCKSMGWFLHDMDLRHERVNISSFFS